MKRVGVVGFGLAGRVFHAPLISSVDGLELAAIVERSGTLAAERYPGVRVYRAFEDVLADDSLDLIVIATPSATHFEMAKQAIEAGKHLVVDKPVATRSQQIGELINMAERRGVMLIPFQNRRWDGDFLTIERIVREGKLGRLVFLESRMDRWSPGATRRPWKDEPEGGGLLLDLGTHLVDQVLTLFGKPEGVWADVLRERDGVGANDSFTLRLRYADGLRVALGSNALSSPAGARWWVRGTMGNFRKQGIDPQEAALGNITRIQSDHWGEESASDWGLITADVAGAMVSRPLATIPGDYRCFYAGVRDALLGAGPMPVRALEAWRTARILEWAEESSRTRREVQCDWSAEPTGA